MRQIFLQTCVLIFLINIGLYVSADDITSEVSPKTVVCDFVQEQDYEMSSYLAPYSSENSDDEYGATAWVTEEYNVLYNLAQIPVGYEIPTTLKAFALSNNISGVEIVPNIGEIYNSDLAVMTKTDDEKMVLTVSQNIADKPESIIRRLMGIGEIKERQASELHSIVDVHEQDERWNAQVAKTVQKGVDKFTGEDVGDRIDYNKIKIERGGSFDDLFAKKQTTLTLKGYPRFDIQLYGLDKAVTLTGDSNDSLVLFASIKNKDVVYPGELYFSESGALYSCHIKN